ncbi:hypothetical protein [Nonomuraea basaltis]|uniref:hypothetical protein n=1 Tax=Nonomuraea basaltis TaxID=2495887 RepID=UPI00148742F5|nr:hypothetical protein [Nonomuraea basaltis]
MGKLVFGTSEADVESFDLAEPAFPFSFGDPREEVVADLGQAVAMGGIGPEHRAADAGFSELRNPVPNGR